MCTIDILIILIILLISVLPQISVPPLTNKRPPLISKDNFSSVKTSRRVD